VSDTIPSSPRPRFAVGALAATRTLEAAESSALASFNILFGVDHSYFKRHCLAEDV